MSFSFLPFARRGLAARLSGDATIAGRGSVPVALSVNDVANPPVPVQLAGPGDVSGIDPSAISRHVPARGAQNHPPDHMAAIEFDAPDLPWIFTPGGPDANGRLTPWLVLVVIEEREGVEIVSVPGQKLRELRLNAAAVATELPDLAAAWAWAHVQIVKEPNDPRTLSEVLAGPASGRLSRIVAPRRLAPDTGYVACLVPRFDQGRDAGLGRVTEPTAPMGPAWITGQDARLPIYHQWSFSTGDGGDFETLARALMPAHPPAEAGGPLAYVGDIHPEIAPIAQIEETLLALPGALRIPDAKPPALTQVADTIVEDLPKLLDAPFDLEQDGASPVLDPLAPPLYGRWYTGQHVVPAATPRWLRTLNLDPRHRAAAGLGAEVVRRHQEDFMEALWTQAGDVARVNDVMDRTRLGGVLLTKIYKKHVRPLPASDLIKLTAPLLALVGKATKTVARSIETSSLVAAMTGANARRMTAPRMAARRAVLRAAQASPGALSKATRALELAADASFDTDPLDLAFDGIAGSRLDRRLDLTQALVSFADLGMNTTLARADVMRLRKLGSALVKTKVQALQLRADIGAVGFLDDRHIARLRRITGTKSLNKTVTSFLNTSQENGGTIGFRLDPGVRDILFRPLDLVAGVMVVERTNAGPVATAKPLAHLGFTATTNAGVAAALERLAPGGLDPGRATANSRPIARSATGAKPAVRPDASTVIRPLNTEGTAVAAFRTATNAHLADITDRHVVAPAKPLALALEATGSEIAEAIQPGSIVLARNRARVGAFNGRFQFSNAATTGDIDPDPSVQVEPDRMLLRPTIPRALFRDLAELAPDRLVPGLQSVEANSIVLLETSPSFVEAFMVGCNVEMMREAQWHGYPSDRRATVFRCFWDRGGGGSDIRPIDTWGAGKALGQNGMTDAQSGVTTGSELVLLVRAELIRRYPGAQILAVPANDDRRLPSNLEGALPPVFAGKVDPSTLLCGFALDRDTALLDNGWFFVIEQQVTEPSFGFDAPTMGEPPTPANWLDATWGQVGAAPGAYFDVSATPVFAGQVANAASFASIAFQRPFRAAIHADKLIEEEQ